MAYLTAGRISEIVKTKYLRKHTYKIKDVTDDQGRFLRKAVVRNKNKSPMIDSTEKIEINYPGIRKEDVFVDLKINKEHKLLMIRMQNRKNKHFKLKRIPVPIDKEIELVNLLIDYQNTLPEDKSPFFNFGVAKAEQIIKKVDMNPHFLRDIRLTHLVTMYGYGSFELTKFAGWKDPRPAERYVRMDVKDLVNKFFMD